MDQKLVQLVMRREKHQYDVLLELKLAAWNPIGNCGMILALTTFSLLTFVAGWWLWQAPIWLTIALCLLACIWAAVQLVWIRSGLPSFKTEVEERIVQAGIVERLADGTDWIQEIYASTTWPLHLFVLGPRPRSLKGWTRLLAMNIDWFLTGTRRLFPLKLIAALRVPIVIAIVLLLSMLRWVNGPDQIISGLYFIIIVIVIYSEMMIPTLIKYKAAADVLHRQMQKRFDA